MNINSASNLDRAKVIHERNKSSISLFLEQKNLLKNPVSEEQYKRIYAKYKDVSAISRDLKITKETSIPRHTSVLSLKEGRIFFIGGNIKDDTCSHFLEYIEDSNTIYPHPSMNIERESHGVCIVNSKIYAIGGYNFRENVWFDSIESISLPDNPQIEYQNNYDIIWMYEPIESNQKGVSPRSEWETYKDRMKYPRSHMSVITQFERFIYVFWGKNGQTDPALINSANEESLHSIERFDCVSEKWEEYIIKSCHKINKMYSPGTVQIASLKRKDPGILFFGGKTEFKSKKSVKHYDNVMLMFLQSNKSRQLESKYYVKGKEFKVKVIQSEALQKKSKEPQKTIEIEFFNGDIEWIRHLNMYTEDQYYYYFLGWKDKWEKLDKQDLAAKDYKDYLEKVFSKHLDPNVQSTINKDENIRKTHMKMLGIDGLKSGNFDHPKHGHSIFMLDKSTLKWTSMPVVKYISNHTFY